MKVNLDMRSGQIEKQRNELTSLYRADGELRRHLHLDEVLHSLVNTAAVLLQADKDSLLIWGENTEPLMAGYGLGVGRFNLSLVSPGDSRLANLEYYGTVAA